MAKGVKTGGRQKGTPNKHPTGFRAKLWAYCESKGADPFEYMADTIVNTDTVVYGVDDKGQPIVGPAVKAETKLRAAEALAPYLEHKLKSLDVEVSGNPEKPLVILLRRKGG